MTGPTFPPLLRGMEVGADHSPFDTVRREAAAGCNPGLIAYRISADRLAAAIVFAPEMPLRKAVVALPVCAIGFQNALGALAPPEVAVHLEWGGNIRVNGAVCGSLQMAAPSTELDAEPDWLVVGLDVDLIASRIDAPGATPDRTNLFEEGCGDIAPELLLEAWARHTLVWINRWMDDGVEPVHAEWRGLAWKIGEEIELDAQMVGFVGIDEYFGLLFKSGSQTEFRSLTSLLKGAT